MCSEYLKERVEVQKKRGLDLFEDIGLGEGIRDV